MDQMTERRLAMKRLADKRAAEVLLDSQKVQPQPAATSPAPATAPSTVTQRATGALARGAAKTAPWVGAAYEGAQVGRVALDPKSTGLDIVNQAAEGAGRLGAAGVGAKLGAMAGSMVAPGPGTLIGGALGAGAGYLGGDALIRAGRSLAGSETSSPMARVRQRTAAVEGVATPGSVTPTVASGPIQRPAPIAPAPDPWSFAKQVQAEDRFDGAMAGSRSRTNASAMQTPGAQAGDTGPMVTRGNDGLRTLATNSGALQSFNNLQGARGSNIRGTRDANGRMVFSGDGTGARPVPNSGWTLTENNARMQKFVDAGRADNERLTMDEVAASAMRAPARYRGSAMQGAAQLQAASNAKPLTLAEVGMRSAQGRLADAQAGLAGEQARGIRENRETIASLWARAQNAKTPKEANELRRQLLAAQGKDSQQGRFAIVDIDTGDRDPLGKPYFRRAAIDVETGELIGERGGAAGGSRPVSYGEWSKVISTDPRWKSKSEAERRAYFDSVYGKPK